MCRRNHMYGWCLTCLGVGILLGYNVETWLVCSVGSLMLIGLGLCIMKQK